MLQIFDAIELLEVIDEKVGHTKPWVVLARNGNTIKKLVVKLYNEGLNADRCVVNEVIGNILAKQFGFKVPEAHFVNIPEDLLMKISPS